LSSCGAAASLFSRPAPANPGRISACLQQAILGRQRSGEDLEQSGTENQPQRCYWLAKEQYNAAAGRQICPGAGRGAAQMPKPNCGQAIFFLQDYFLRGRNNQTKARPILPPGEPGGGQSAAQMPQVWPEGGIGRRAGAGQPHSGVKLMNFVDILLENIAAISTADVINIVLDKWGTVRHGITEETAANYPQFINDLLHIADFNNSACFEGLVAFVCYCDRLGMENTVKAFRNIKDDKDAEILEEIFHLGEVQKIYAGAAKSLPDETVERIVFLGAGMYFNQPESDIWELLEKYIDKELYSYTLHIKTRLKN
jgi:hypothetical protein